MIGSEESISLSLPDIWRAWYSFRSGKKRSLEIDNFTYYLEENIYQLYVDLNTGSYRHGSYKTFELTDTKKRTISVASIRDRVVHRLLYDYLVKIFDKRFVHDAWSCRKNKGLLKAITRTQNLLSKFNFAYVWRGDITKFFDSIDQEILKKLLRRRVHDYKALQLLDEIITSYSTHMGIGIPIGNLTSQIFTNIYLSEYDRYIFHFIKPLGYVRYGDDFVLIVENLSILEDLRKHLITFLDQELKLSIHKTNNIVVPVRRGVHFLGCEIYPTGKRLRKSIYNRIRMRLNFNNIASYRSLLLNHSKKDYVKWLDWRVSDILMDQL